MEKEGLSMKGEGKRPAAELAKRYGEIAQQEINEKRRRRLIAVNDLTTGLRPGVWIDGNSLA